MKDQSVLVVTRSFQRGATFDSFDKNKFDQGVVAPIRKLLKTAPKNLKAIVVITCGDSISEYAEEVRDDMTPTTHNLREAFPEEVSSGMIIPEICYDWGLNAGSATALNDGFEVAKAIYDVRKVLMWSPEIDLDGFMMQSMVSHAEYYNLPLVGYFRNRWYQRLQWTVAQNTCALWDTALLMSIHGFNPSCNGDGKTTVHTPEFGEVPLAGMEDVEAYLRASKAQGNFLRWGMVGMDSPAFWNLALKEPGTPEYEKNRQKIARQGLVMDAYAKRIFPGMEPQQVYDKMMQAAHLR